MKSRKKNIETSCGDEGLDNLISQGEIKNLKTCCNHHVYSDHNLYITMRNDTHIESNSTLISKSLAIKINGTTYSQKIEDSSSFVSLLSIFTMSIPKEKQTAKNSYSKSIPGNDGAVIEKIEKSEFDNIFNQLPLEVQRTLKIRQQGAKLQVTLLSNSNESPENPNVSHDKKRQAK